MKKTRRPAHSRHTMQTARDLAALTQAPDPERFALLADVLALWARYMLTINPRFAARLYMAVVDEWRDNRGGLYPADRDDERERMTVRYHGAFNNRLRELYLNPREWPVSKFEREQAARLGAEMRFALREMEGRAWDASAAAGDVGAIPPEGDVDVWAELGDEFQDFIEDEGMVM